jgi:hypothetical protein
LGDLDDVVKTTSETKQAMMAYLGADVDDDILFLKVESFLTICILIFLSFKFDSMYVTIVLLLRFKLPEDDRKRPKHVVVVVTSPHL